jgi:hypothetical protein
MSYFEKIISSIDDEVEELLIHISKKFDIDKNELIMIWKQQKIKTKPDTPKSITTTPQENSLLKLNTSELKEMFKSKGLKVSGTKNDLVARIVESEKNKKSSLLGFHL